MFASLLLLLLLVRGKQKFCSNEIQNFELNINEFKKSIMKKIYLFIVFLFVVKTMDAQYREIWYSHDASSLIVGCENMDDDPNMEIVTYWYDPEDFEITIIDGVTGKLKWQVWGKKWDLKYDIPSNPYTPKLIDVNSDGKFELLFHGDIEDENGVLQNKMGMHLFGFGSFTKSIQLSANDNVKIENYPNPFNSETTIKYNVPNSSLVTVKVYDMHGNEIKTLENELKSAGDYEIPFNRSDLASGTYFYQVKVGNKIGAKKMVVF